MRMPRNQEIPGQAQAQTILDARGNSPRLFKNALVFLVADRTRLAELDEAMRFHLAWDSIENDKDQLGLDGFQVRQVTNQKVTWNTAIKGRLGETFCWLLFPTQPTPQATVEWQAVKLSGPDPLAVRASKKLRSDTQMASQFAPPCSGKTSIKFLFGVTIMSPSNSWWRIMQNIPICNGCVTPMFSLRAFKTVSPARHGQWKLSQLPIRGMRSGSVM